MRLFVPPPKIEVTDKLPRASLPLNYEQAWELEVRVRHKRSNAIPPTRLRRPWQFRQSIQVLILMRQRLLSGAHRLPPLLQNAVGLPPRFPSIVSQVRPNLFLLRRHLSRLRL